MSSFKNITLEECMCNYVKENEMKDEDVVKGFSEKCPICGIKMFENNHIESIEEAVTFFTCSNCGFEKQIFYKVDIEGNLVYENEKNIFNPKEEISYNINVKVDTILQWKNKIVNNFSWIKLNKSEIKHLKGLLENNLNIYKEVLEDVEENDMVNKKLRELKNIIKKINRL